MRIILVLAGAVIGCLLLWHYVTMPNGPKPDSLRVLDGRALEVCSSPRFYMLPMFVFVDCAGIAAALDDPGVIRYWHDKAAQGCSGRGFGSAVSLNDRLVAIDREFARPPTHEEANEMERVVIQFANPGMDNLVGGAIRCP